MRTRERAREREGAIIVRVITREREREKKRERPEREREREIITKYLHVITLQSIYNVFHSLCEIPPSSSSLLCATTITKRERER